MALALGDVITRIGGDGGGDPAPTRRVYDLGNMPITANGQSGFKVPDLPEGATLVATLEWAGPETGEFAVVMEHGPDAAFGVAINTGTGFPPMTLVSTASGGGESGVVIFVATAEGFTATRLTVIIIPTIDDAA